MTQRDVIAGVERTSEYRPPNTVQCDAPDCGEQIYVERYPRVGGSGAHAARFQAHEAGWGFVDGQDLCPKHFAERGGNTET